MGQITVTMPLKQYEDMQKEIEYLKTQKIKNFLTDEWREMKIVGYSLDVEALVDYIKSTDEGLEYFDIQFKEMNRIIRF